MNSSWQKGASSLAGIVTLVVILTIILVTPKNGGNSQGGWNWSAGSTTSSNSNYGPNGGSDTVPGAQIVSTSPYRSSIYLGSGNASYAYQSYEEYITLENSGSESINITGWQLRNGKDKRAYYNSSSLQRFSADLALIPQASLLLSNSNGPLQDVVLKPGERAVITTGKFGVQSPYKITSFKENMCTGYIESHSSYSFTPPLNSSCPRPALEPGVENLDPACRDFINTLSTCRTPDFKEVDYYGEQCNNCVNGKKVSGACVAFIKEHYNYQGCVANHKNDPRFYGNTWRIFLNRGWEMWAEKYETIELYDRLGELVNYQSY